MVSLLVIVLGCPRATPTEPAVVPPSVFQESQAAGWVLRAHVAEARGDLHEAERALEWLIRFERGSPWAWITVARFHLRQAHLTQAAAAVAEARRLDPGLREAELLQARVDLASGRPEQARDRALDLIGDPELGLGAATIAVDAGRAACRLEPVWLALRDRPVADASWALLGLTVAEAVGDEPLAAQLRPLVARDAEDPVDRGRAWLALDEPERAAAAFAVAGEAGLQGDALLAAGQPERALQATAYERDLTAAWVRAGALEVLGRPDEAEIVVQADTDGLDAALRLSRLRGLRGDHEGALLALEGQDDPDALLARAALLELVDPDGAAEAYRALVASHPERGEAWLAVVRLTGDAEAAGWVVDLAPCGAVDWLTQAAEVLPSCDAAEALRLAVAARPADADLRNRWSEVDARCTE